MNFCVAGSRTAWMSALSSRSVIALGVLGGAVVPLVLHAAAGAEALRAAALGETIAHELVELV